MIANRKRVVYTEYSTCLGGFFMSLKKLFLSFILGSVLLMSICGIAFAGTITVFTGEGGTYAANGSLSSEDPGSVVTITAVPEDGYRFDCWVFTALEGESLVTRTSWNNPEDFNVYDRSVTAFFEKTLPDPPSSDPIEDNSAETETHTVTATVEPVGTGYVNGKGFESITEEYTPGKVVGIKAQPIEGYRFVGWKENGTVFNTVADQIFDINRDRTLIAVFEAVPAQIVPPEPSAALPDPVSQLPVLPTADPFPIPTFPPITRYTIQYLPGSYAVLGTPVNREWNAGPAWLEGQLFARQGYTQTGWAVADGVVKAYELNQSLFINGDMTLYPYWERVSVPLYLTVNWSGSGTISLSGGNLPNGWTGKLEPGQSYTLVFHPYAGNYVYSILFAGWYRHIEYGNEFTVTYEMMQGKNQTLNARFSSIYSSPKTGDNSNIVLWSALGLTSAVCLGALFLLKKKKK